MNILNGSSFSTSMILFYYYLDVADIMLIDSITRCMSLLAGKL